jgi:hypothetical protein
MSKIFVCSKIIYYLCINKNDKDMTNAQHTHTIPATHMKKFILGGQAIFTLENDKSKNRFTYQINFPQQKDQYKKSTGKLDRSGGLYFVSVLTGNDNIAGYTYIGFIKKTEVEERNPLTGLVEKVVRHRFIHHAKKSRISAAAPSVVVIDALIKIIARDAAPNGVTLYHEGNCGCCGRKLTVPNSILTGIGPDCEKKYDSEGQRREKVAKERKRKISVIFEDDKE